MEALRTYIIVGKKDITVLKAFFAEKCKNFAKYKGKRSPSCGCLPCLEVYVNEKSEKLGFENVMRVI